MKLALGHDFSPEEDRPGGAPGVIISNRLWRDRLARSPAVLGKPITLNGADYTLVGILPPGFRFGLQPEDVSTDVYTLLGQGDPLTLQNRAVHNIACIARLKSNVGIGQAQAEMNTVQEAIDRLYPSTERGHGTFIIPLKQEFVGDVGQTLILLLGAVGLVLLIACANVANLCLARSAARAREFAVRLALGATRAHILRHLLTESVLLSLAGGVLGLAVAKGGLTAVLAAVPGSLPRSENIGIDPYVLLFAFAVSIAVGILFGLAPALKSSNPDLQTALKEGSRGSTRAHHRAQSGLVIVQMALTLVLLAGASLLFRSVQNLWQVNPGFDPHHIITFKVGLSPSLTNTPSRMRIAYQQLAERVREIPGVKAADLTTLIPLSGHSDAVPFWVSSQQPASMAEAPRAQSYSTGPDYLRVMRIPLLRGRFFTLKDTLKSTPVVVINSVLAHSYFPHSDPVGKTITFANVGAYRIVGVVGHVRDRGLGDPISNTQAQTYTPFYQISDRWLLVMHTSTTVVVRTPLDTTNLMPAIRAAVHEMGSDQPIYDVQTMPRIVSQSMSSRRLPTILLGTFAGLALLLASIGIYGVISYSVTQRVQEIGIRMALGANRWNVLRMIVAQGLRLALPGLAIGIAAALLITRLLSSFSRLLYGVRATDPLTLLAVSLMLIGTALLACYIPARRAAKLDPMTALRQE